jgi:hypothetical protein
MPSDDVRDRIDIVALDKEGEVDIEADAAK